MSSGFLTCDIFLPFFTASILALILSGDDHVARETPLCTAAEVSLENIAAFPAFFISN